MPLKQFSYNKKEKLKSRKQLQQIFSTGKTFSIFPLKVLYQLADEQDNIIKTGVGVSKKNFKKAVDRNRIKRLLRECYRTQKIPLHNCLLNNKKKLAVFILYIDKVMPEYNLIQQKILLVTERLIKALNETVS
jgi:ribonuclease P protein component